MLWWFLAGAPQQAGYRGVPWIPCIRLPKFSSHLVLATLGDGRSISINARSDDKFNVVVMAASLNMPTTAIRLIANGIEIASNPSFSLNYLWSKNQMATDNALEVEATDEYGNTYRASTNIPRP